MFVVRGQASVLCNYGPLVAQLLYFGSAQIHHGFDGNDHPAVESGSAACGTEIGNVGIFVEIDADAVTDILSDGGAAVPDAPCVDRGTDITDSRAVPDLSHAHFKALSGNFDELFRLLGDFADREGIGIVAVVAVDERADVDLDDIALLQDFVRGRDAVDDFVIDGDAGRTGETAVTEEGRLCAALFDIVTDPIVNHFGGYAGLYEFSSELKSLTGNSAGDPHEFDFFG